MSKPLYSLSWMLGLLLAPHTLTLLGNLVGAYQYLFFVGLALAVGLYWINARSVTRVTDGSQTSYPGNRNTAVTLLLLASRTISTIALSTVLLVTAGFVFNETFVYWFPNFAFAFALLGVVLAVHLWGPSAALKLQLGATAIVLFGLISLITVGLWGGVGSGWGVGDDVAVSFKPHGIAAVWLLFAGFDLCLIPTGTNQRLQARTVQWALMATALMMGLWAVICLLYVPAAKLADSFIPHLLAARNAGGEAGRALMGTVVIAGSVAAVNALFKSMGELLTGFSIRWRRYTGYKYPNIFERHAFWASFVAAAVGVMMASGMAGTEEIDLYVQAGFILWIFYYGGMNLSALMKYHRHSRRRHWQGRVFPAIGAVTMVLGGGVLTATAPNGGLFLKILLSLMILAILSVLTKIFLKRFLGNDMNWIFKRQR